MVLHAPANFEFFYHRSLKQETNGDLCRCIKQTDLLFYFLCTPINVWLIVSPVSS